MIYCDAHFHAAQCKALPSLEGHIFFGCTCAHSKEEFLEMEKLCEKNSKFFVKSFGIHPQSMNEVNLDAMAQFLEMLCRTKRIGAIGETGFDFFTDEFRKSAQKQEQAWKISLALAKEHSLPIVVHDRKALDIIFKYTADLKKIPSVLFHSFAFGLREAQSILLKGINAYFSFGKQILNGNKKSIECVTLLPQERLLLETDAPFQTLRGEERTLPEEIFRVYEKAMELRGIPAEALEKQTLENFSHLFFLDNVLK